MMAIMRYDDYGWTRIDSYPEPDEFGLIYTSEGPCIPGPGGEPLPVVGGTAGRSTEETRRLRAEARTERENREIDANMDQIEKDLFDRKERGILKEVENISWPQWLLLCALFSIIALMIVSRLIQ